ncbi:MAG: GNAT family N-acetyltransferase [Gammaproteobacteria bacterium]
MTAWPIIPRTPAENQELVLWARERLNIDFGLTAHAIGVRNENEPLAVTVYNNFKSRPNGTVYMCDASIVSISPRWCNRSVLRQLFHYPFVILGVLRLQTICEAKNPRIRKFNQHLGFIEEGILREAWDMGGDAVVWSMLPHECKWLRPEDWTDVSSAA